MVCRNSKLTFLLQDCLGGNSRTMMVITLCPTESSSDETLFTLQFATRVRNITLGAARKNVNAKNLEDALKSLKVMLRESKKKRSQLEDTVTDLKKEVKKASEKMSTQMDSKLRIVEDFKRDTNAQIAALSKQNTDLEVRFHEERESKTHLQQEVENLQKALKKSNDQLKEMQREREAVLLTARQKEREIAYLKLKTGHGVGSRGPSEMLASSAAPTNTVLAGALSDGGRGLTSPKTVPTSPLTLNGTSTSSSMLKTPVSAVPITISSPSSGTDHKRLLSSESTARFNPSNNDYSVVSATDSSVIVIVTSDGDEVLENAETLPSAPTTASRMLPPSALPVPVRSSNNEGLNRKLKYSSSVEKGSSRIPQSAERSNASTPVSSSQQSKLDRSSDQGVIKTPTTTSSLMRTTASSMNKSAATKSSTPSTSSSANKPSATKSSSFNSMLSSEFKAIGSNGAAVSGSQVSSVAAAGGGGGTNVTAGVGKPLTATTTGSTISASRQSIAQRSKEALLKHQVSISITIEYLIIITGHYYPMSGDSEWVIHSKHILFYVFFLFFCIYLLI